MSVICRTFVGNAWRSDLCSNCFKSLEDHSDSPPGRMTAVHPRYVPQAPTLYQSRGISTSLKWRLSDPDRISRRDFASQTKPGKEEEGKGILVRGEKKRRHSNVDFATEEALVIGYGGNDYDSDQSPWEMGSDDGSIDLDLLDDNDEDRKITRQTRNNTEFNSSNRNLLSSARSGHVEHRDSHDLNAGARKDPEPPKNSEREKRYVDENRKNEERNQSREKEHKKNSNRNGASRKEDVISNDLSNGSINRTTIHKTEDNRNHKTINVSTNGLREGVIRDSKSSNSKESLVCISKSNNPSSKNNRDSVVRSSKSNNSSSKDLRVVSVCNYKSTRENEIQDRTNTKSTSTSTVSVMTYNNIQRDQSPEKKLSQYYFPSSTDPMNSFLYGSKNPTKVESLNASNGKDQSGNSNIVNRSLLKNEFSPLNTGTYSILSELNKKRIGSEHSSDSDYSTCRMTAGDSTDSESLQEEVTRAVPCSSFLHGKHTNELQQSNTSSLDERDKKFDAGSSTSGDVSNLSDDSDVANSDGVTSYAIRSSRSNRISPEKGDVEPNVADIEKRADVSTKTSANNSSLDVDEKSSDDNWVKVSNSDSDIVNSDRLSVIKNRLSVQNNISPCASKSNSPGDCRKSSASNDQHQNASKTSRAPAPPDCAPQESTEEVGRNCSDSNAEAIQTSKIKNKNNKLDNVAKPNHRNDVKILEKSISEPFPSSRTVTNSNNHSKKERERVTSWEEQKNAKNLAFRNAKDEVVRSASEAVLCEKNGGYHSSFIEQSENDVENAKDNSPLQNHKSTLSASDCLELGLSEEDYREMAPEAINNRQSKLAALALELELARRDSDARLQRAPPSLPPPPAELRAKCSSPLPGQGPFDDQHFPTIRKGSGVSCASRLTSTLPDVLPEAIIPPQPKSKRTRFSLKKLLKRNKDFSPSTSGKESSPNPKAWKRQTFDRNRLSLEIVHPMDLATTTSGDSTPTEEGRYAVSSHPGKAASCSRARSLSALPQLRAMDFAHAQEEGRSETLPYRKAGTVVERKKNRPALVRTPSCSTLPNTSNQEERTPPPKPPPPPKSHPPPPPPSQQQKTVSTPARPPPPKVPDSHQRFQTAQESRPNTDIDYANLGNVRLLMTPKKPQRPSAPSCPPGGGERAPPLYEPLRDEEEDPYTYLDESEVKVVADDSNAEVSVSSILTRPWTSLQTSYSAIAAANYDALAEIVSTSMTENDDRFDNGGKPLRWTDFVLDSIAPELALPDKHVYSAIYRLREEEKLSLVVTPRRQSGPQRHNPRFPVLASFHDHLPGGLEQGLSSSPYAEWASVYALGASRTRLTSVLRWAASGCEQSGSHVRDCCFVLLQLIHALKGLQAEGTEEVHCDLDRLILVSSSEGNNDPPVFVFLPEDRVLLTTSDPKRTLCQATLDALLHLLRIDDCDQLATCRVSGEALDPPVSHTFGAICRALTEEKASSLSQAKSLLEYMLWGPVDVRVSRDVDAALQRWLDLQRAQALKSYVSQMQSNRQRRPVDVYQQFQLVFLLQASVKSLRNVISKL